MFGYLKPSTYNERKWYGSNQLFSIFSKKMVGFLEFNPFFSPLKSGISFIQTQNFNLYSSPVTILLTMAKITKAHAKEQELTNGSVQKPKR